MAHAVEDDLGNRAAALERLEPGFVIDRLGQAQQRAALIQRVAAETANGCAEWSGACANGSAALISRACSPIARISVAAVPLVAATSAALLAPEDA